MNPPTDVHSFFATPVWLRAQYSGTRQLRKPHDGSSSSSPSPPPSSPSSSSNEAAPEPSSTPVNTASEDAPDPFHRAPLTRRGRHSKHRTLLLAAHNLVPIPTPAWSLRKRHLNVLTTILYHSLLARDWKRADRAFGCLLRGKDVDIRRVWGVGVELLLRRAEGGTANAVEFLERLILFFPYRSRLHSHHPALVGHEGEEEVPMGEPMSKHVDAKKREAVLKRRKARRMRPPPYHSALEFQPALFSLLVEGSKYKDLSELDTVREEGEELDATRPEKIKERLEELMLTPPWSDMESLLCLRGMICLWIADMELQKDEISENQTDEKDSDTDMRNANEPDTEQESEMRKKRAQELRREAKGHFEAVKKKGGSIPLGIEDSLAFDEEEDEDAVDP